MVISVFLHMARVFYHGAYKPPREFNWVIGVILLMLTLLLSLHRLPAAVGPAGPLGGHRRHEHDGLHAGVREPGALRAPRRARRSAPNTLLRWYVLHVLMLPFVIVIFMADPLLACPQGRRHLGTAVMARGGDAMTEIPEHLRKRAEEARKKAEAAEGGGDAPARRRPTRRPASAAAPPQRGREPHPRPPARALEGGPGPGRAAATPTAAPVAAAAAAPPSPPAAPATGAIATAAPGPPLAAGPGGHTQRLLTVVKAGSIQDVKAAPIDKVHVWPHLLVVEFVALLACTRVPARVLDRRERAAAHAGQRQPDAEPVEGAVVLPRPPGAAHDVPPDGRRRDHPGHRPVRPDPGAVHRPQPVQQARGPQVRHLA